MDLGEQVEVEDHGEIEARVQEEAEVEALVESMRREKGEAQNRLCHHKK